MTQSDSLADNLAKTLGPPIDRVGQALGTRPLVLVGIMGSGKSSIGRRLAQSLGREFIDADREIERAANRRIPEIFAEFGEDYFRSGERRVIGRLLQRGPVVIASGGGAFIDAETRNLIACIGVSVWLKVSLETVLPRVAHRSDRPLLLAGDPKAILRDLLLSRDPIYAQADIAVETGNVSLARATKRVVEALAAHFVAGDAPA